MNNSPIAIFKKWYTQELKLTTVRIPSACCLSTNGIDGFPNSRFVSLKDILEDHFIITGTLASRKGIEIEISEKISLTFWWTETERQIRIQGNATVISNALADKYFSERNRADVGLMFIAYNLRRIMNILDKNIFKKFLQELGFLFFEKTTYANENAIVRTRPIFEVPKWNLILRAA